MRDTERIHIVADEDVAVQYQCAGSRTAIDINADSIISIGVVACDVAPAGNTTHPRTPVAVRDDVPLVDAVLSEVERGALARVVGRAAIQVRYVVVADGDPVASTICEDACGGLTTAVTEMLIECLYSIAPAP